MGSLNQEITKNIHTSLIATQAWQQPNPEHIKRVEQRVIKQLLQALIYEEVIDAEYKDDTFTISAKDRHHQQVKYILKGKKYQSFGLLRMDDQDVIREDHEGNISSAQLNLVIGEIIRPIQQADQLENFITELKRTFIHDVQSQPCKSEYKLPVVQYNYDVLESYLMDGHPYHPSYKSRVGFSLTDNLKYGVEFSQPIHLVWLAIHKSILSTNQSKNLDESFFTEQLTEQDLLSFNTVMSEKSVNVDDYVWVPVHPWQWENTLIHTFFEELNYQQIIFLGRGEYAYIPQQSLRTLTNLHHPEKPYIKLSMSITNTSSSRILAAHTAMNGPLITDWLKRLASKSEIAKSLNFKILGEVYASAVDFTKIDPSHAKQTYGTIGSLWRESVHQYLENGEDAIPLNGIGHIQNDRQPLVQYWINQYGNEAWVEQLLSVVIQPILFLLFAEGIGSESHGQNIILVHKDGWPTRIILKDFHDGVRFSAQHLTHPEEFPVLNALPAEHAKANRMSFIETDDLNAVRDFSCACLFFVALSDIAISFQKAKIIDEDAFWKKAAQVIHDFQNKYPEHQERYEKFDVFAPQFCIESLTKRRLFGDKDVQLKFVNNPLHQYADQKA